MGCSASRSRPHTFITKSSDDKPFSDSPSSSPFPRARSLQATLVHHPPLRKGDTHHLVCLTYSTYGSHLLLDPTEDRSHSPETDPEDSSIINAWELMDGLGDAFDFDDGTKKAATLYTPTDSPQKTASIHYLGSDLSPEKLLGAFDSVSPPLSKPMWKHLSEEALLAKIDPNVGASDAMWSHLSEKAPVAEKKPVEKRNRSRFGQSTVLALDCGMENHRRIGSGGCFGLRYREWPPL